MKGAGYQKEANDRVLAEVLAAGVYRALGVEVPEAKLVWIPTVSGRGIGVVMQYAARAVPGEPRGSIGSDASLAKGFMADVLVANWDVVGLDYDNIVYSPGGVPVRVDLGGSFMYLAQGGRKDYGAAPTEHGTMLDAAVNPQSAAAFGQIPEAELRAQARRIGEVLTDEKIDEMLTTIGPSRFEDPKVAEQIRGGLLARRDWMREFGEGTEKAAAASADAEFEQLHPRGEGGRFVSKFGVEPAREEDLGRQERLEREADAGIVAVAALVAEVTQGAAPAEDEDEDEAPGSWDKLSSDQQDAAYEKWKEDNYQGFLDSEIESWRENLPDEARESLRGDTDWQEEFTQEFLTDWVSAEEPAEGEPSAVRWEVDPDSVDAAVGAIRNADPAEIVWNAIAFRRVGAEGQPELPGTPEPDFAALREAQREEFTSDFEAEFERRVEKYVDAAEPPDYLGESVGENMEENWNQQDDEWKFTQAGDYLELGGGRTPPALLPVTAPERFTVDNDAPESEAVKRLGWALIGARAEDVAELRGRGLDLKAERAQKALRVALSQWYGSSSSEGGVALQLAAEEELGARGNLDKQQRSAARAWPGPDGTTFEDLKAVVRASWETTQWIYAASGVTRQELYRGLEPRGDYAKETEATEHHAAPGDFTQLPALRHQQNGAMSWSTSRSSACSFGTLKLRALVPPTAVLVPLVLSTSSHGEREVIVLGAPLVAWDAWDIRPPTAEEKPFTSRKDAAGRYLEAITSSPHGL